MSHNIVFLSAFFSLGAKPEAPLTAQAEGDGAEEQSAATSA